MAFEQLFLGLGFVIICILAIKAPKLFASKAPVKTAKAEVLSRKGEMSSAMLPSQWGGRPNYQVDFSIGEETIVLTVDASQYTRLLEGTCGLLTWRDNTLVDFVSESNTP